MDIYERTMNGKERLDGIIAHIQLYMAKIWNEKFHLSPSSFQTVIDMTSRYRFALRDCVCVCQMCSTLPQLLTFETFVFAWSLEGSNLAGIPWYKRIEELTQAWLRAPDNFNLLHNYYSQTFESKVGVFK